MSLEQISKEVSILYNQAAFGYDSIDKSVEVALKFLNKGQFSDIETAAIKATVIFELLACRVAESNLYNFCSDFKNLDSNQKIEINRALAHLFLPDIQSDAIGQLLAWHDEIRRIIAFGLPRRKRITPGDVLLVPLFNGKCSYAQVVPNYRVHLIDCISEEPLPIVELKRYPAKYGPIQAGYRFLASHGPWFYVGKMELTEPRSPGFVGRNYHLGEDGTIAYGPWYVYEAGSDRIIGDHLPERYRDYELNKIWSVMHVERRILTGSYGEYAELAYATEPWFNNGRS